jgi:hypothetical protein
LARRLYKGLRAAGPSPGRPAGGDRGASGRRQRDTAHAARQSDASEPAPTQRWASAGSRPSSEPPREAGIAGRRARVCPVAHHFALSKPASVSAPSTNSFSRASCPIFA